MLFRRTVIKGMFCCLVCLSLSMAHGCRAPWPFAQTKIVSAPSPAEMKQYKQAIAAFQQKAYSDAIKKFEAIRTQTRDKRFARMALYGLSISKLMAAKTANEHSDALLLWQRWIENAPPEFDYENPSLVDALIQEKMLFSNIPLTTKQSQQADQEPMVSRWLLIESKLELDRLRAQVDNASKTLDKCQKTIQVQEKEIRELKRQIKALEVIDQKIQEKKNALPTGDSPTQR